MTRCICFIFSTSWKAATVSFTKAKFLRNYKAQIKTCISLWLGSPCLLEADAPGLCRKILFLCYQVSSTSCNEPPTSTSPIFTSLVFLPQREIRLPKMHPMYRYFYNLRIEIMSSWFYSTPSKQEKWKELGASWILPLYVPLIVALDKLFFSTSALYPKVENPLHPFQPN